MYSKLMLGTVQFGMNYGVANTTGKPSFETVKAILKEAYDGGINALDTAPEYGDSEEVIGKALKELGLTDSLKIVTKIPRLPADADPEKFICDSLRGSLKRLQKEVISAALFHVEDDGIYLDVLKSMKEKGLILSAGISLNTQAHKEDGGSADCLQIPCSILDHRFDSCFNRGGRHCFIRGVYLQGMLLMPAEKVFVKEVLSRRMKLEKLGIPMAELALRYLFAKPGSKSILTGVETVEQLRENLRIAGMEPLTEDVLTEIDKIVFPPLDEICVSPWMWKRYKEINHLKD
ncbi:MAG: aldo/keto reductase [Lentisphaeria bacterium]|nr:aldo/keto reductase [Lentisphaeria bacterium]